MSETVKTWFKDLYTSQIEEAKLTIANERIWLNGAGAEGDEEAMFNHQQNIDENEEYIEILERKLEELDGE